MKSCAAQINHSKVYWDLERVLLSKKKTVRPGTLYTNRQNIGVKMKLNWQHMVGMARDTHNWLWSLCLREAGAGGSNPLTPTNFSKENQTVNPQLGRRKTVRFCSCVHCVRERKQNTAHFAGFVA